MKQKGPFSKMPNWIVLPGAKRKRGVSVLRSQRPGLQTGAQCCQRSRLLQEIKGV